jgi:TRAP-type mannitol/chloroaromatic compound transport system permease small subunit
MKRLQRMVRCGQKLALCLDGGIRRISAVAAWLNAVLIGVIILQVVLRYAFGRGLVILEEIQWHLYATAIMLGMAYVLAEDANIRLDIVHARLSKRTQEYIEIAGILFLLMPLIYVFFSHSIDFVATAWRLGERSDAPMGLPFRWAIKAVIPLSFGLLFAAALSRMLKAFHNLFGQSGDFSNGHQ